MIRIINLFLLILLVLCCQLFSQQKAKNISFGDDAKIEEIKATENYVSVKVSTQNGSQTTAYFFDKVGDIIFERNRIDNKWIIQSEISESLSYFIVIDEGSEGTEGSPGLDGTIYAYDIKTGNEIWHSILNGYRYRISPNGRYMIPQAPAIESGPSGSRFEIFDLKDGSIISNNLKLNGWHADWFDNERTVIVVPRMVSNPEGRDLREENFKKMREREVLNDSLVHLRLGYAIDMRIGKITKEEYQQRAQEISEKIDKISKEKGERKRRRGYPSATIPGAAKMMIYNIHTLQIEAEKDIYTADGKPVIVRPSGSAIGSVNIERLSQDIYLYGYEGKSSPSLTCLVKLDKNLNVKTLTLLGAAKIFKTSIGDEIYFHIARKDSQFIVDKATSALIPNQKINTKMGEIDLDFNSLMKEKMYIPNVRVKENGRALEFSSKDK